VARGTLARACHGVCVFEFARKHFCRETVEAIPLFCFSQLAFNGAYFLLRQGQFMPWGYAAKEESKRQRRHDRDKNFHYYAPFKPDDRAGVSSGPAG
jgi:hypothetical protein